ncbi:hypothetical protein TNCV_2876511 [Trichonephila clavipes]|nr:hypothetical protein TNCV_2876511 [Trichonephila clavipes]
MRKLFRLDEREHLNDVKYVWMIKEVWKIRPDQDDFSCHLNEKVSNHGSIPITIDCNVVAFIVFEEGFHQPVKRTKQKQFRLSAAINVMHLSRRRTTRSPLRRRMDATIFRLQYATAEKCYSISDHGLFPAARRSTVRQFLFGTRESCWRYIGNPICPGLVDAPVRCQPPNPRDAPLNARLMMPQLVIGVISLARYVAAA